jgi:hypothetical protein
VAIVAFLALASYLTTTTSWSTDFASGEFRLNIQEANGKPIKGAYLRIYHAGSDRLAFGFPLDNHVEGRDLVSDENGQVTAFRADSAHRAGKAWTLFWVLPIGGEAPDYECEIGSGSHVPYRFAFDLLFKTPMTALSDLPRTRLNVDGRQVDVPVFERSFSLAK